jgi:DNA-binding transcriptional ArsR family regulator
MSKNEVRLMKEGKIIKLETRRRIYNFILDYSGLHLREISRKMDIPKTTLNYHINYLKDRGLIINKSEGRYVRIYVLKNSVYKYKEILGLLRQKTSRNILLIILKWTVSSRREISVELDMHPNTISNHLNKLLEMNIIEQAPVGNGIIHRTDGGVIERSPIGREKFYRLTSSWIDLVYEAFIIYEESLFDDPSIKATTKTMYARSHRLPERIYSPDSAFDSVFEVLFEIFPHPYHA